MSKSLTNIELAGWQEWSRAVSKVGVKNAVPSNIAVADVQRLLATIADLQDTAKRLTQALKIIRQETKGDRASVLRFIHETAQSATTGSQNDSGKDTQE